MTCQGRLNTTNLLVHHGALGDWALVLHIMRGLSGRTFAVTGWSKAKLAERLVPGVSAVSMERAPFAQLYGPIDDMGLMSSEFEAFDDVAQVISFVSDGSDFWAENIRKCCPCVCPIFVRPQVPQDWPTHTYDWFMHQIHQQGGRVDLVDIPAVSNPCGPIVIHPGSGGRHKCWPPNRYERVITKLQGQGHRVLPLLGEVEVDQWDAALLARWQVRYDAMAVTTLDQLVESLVEAKVYIGNDSGPSHIAAQLGLPTLALFGPTCPKRWAPLGPNVTIISPQRLQPMEWLEPDVVIETCSRIVKTPV